MHVGWYLVRGHAANFLHNIRHHHRGVHCLIARVLLRQHRGLAQGRGCGRQRRPEPREGVGRFVRIQVVRGVGDHFVARTADARLLLLHELGLHRLDHLHAQQAAGPRQLQRAPKLLGGLHRRVAERVPVRLGTAEVRLHGRLDLHRVLRRTGPPHHALARRVAALARLRVPEHVPQPHLGVHLHLLQHVLPEEVVGHNRRGHHFLQQFPQLLRPGDGQVQRRQGRERGLQVCQLVLDHCSHRYTSRLLLVYLLVAGKWRRSENV